MLRLSLILSFLFAAPALGATLPSLTFTATKTSHVCRDQGNSSVVPLSECQSYQEWDVGVEYQGYLSVLGPDPDNSGRTLITCTIGGIACPGSRNFYLDDRVPAPQLAFGSGPYGIVTNYVFDPVAGTGTMLGFDELDQYSRVRFAFTDVSEVPIAAMPLPASALLLIAGLGGLAFWRSRQVV